MLVPYVAAVATVALLFAKKYPFLVYHAIGEKYSEYKAVEIFDR